MMNRNRFGIRRIKVTGKRQDQTSQICRAAGTPPWPTHPVMRSIAGQRVMVKERFAVNSEAGQNAIIKGSLHGVGVSAIEIEMDHAVGPLQEGDRRAGLCVALEVWQIVIFGESLVLGG